MGFFQFYFVINACRQLFLKIIYLGMYNFQSTRLLFNSCIFNSVLSESLHFYLMPVFINSCLLFYVLIRTNYLIKLTTNSKQQGLMNNNIFPPSNGYENVVQLNKRKIRNIQAQYFRNQYQQAQMLKNNQRQQQKRQKQRQKFIFDQRQKQYQNDLQKMRQRKQVQKDYLSGEYSNSIDYKNSKIRYQKDFGKVIDNESNEAATWIRDGNIQRDIDKRKKLYYSQALQNQIKIKQEKQYEKRLIQQTQKQKIDRQAREILQKQFQYMEAKHRQKSLFQKRQNQILGLQNDHPNMEDSRTLDQRDKQRKKVERQLYRQGLQAQFEIQQNRHQRKRQYSPEPRQQDLRYNPISNPIPFVYKNPNVLRMLNS